MVSDTHRNSKQIGRSKFSLPSLVFWLLPCCQKLTKHSREPDGKGEMAFAEYQPSITKPTKEGKLELRENCLTTNPLPLKGLW